MATITLPSDLERRLADEANRRGTTLELLALAGLRELFPPPTSDNDLAGTATLFDYLKDYIGAVDGPSEPLSEECGRRFADGLEEKHRQTKL